VIAHAVKGRPVQVGLEQAHGRPVEREELLGAGSTEHGRDPTPNPARATPPSPTLTSSGRRHRFRRYWLLVGPFSALIRRSSILTMETRVAITDEQSRRPGSAKIA
jgi:hypothetical protein